MTREKRTRNFSVMRCFRTKRLSAMTAGETLFSGGGNVGTRHDPLVGRLKGMVCLAVACAGARFLFAFQCGTEVIL